MLKFSLVVITTLVFAGGPHAADAELQERVALYKAKAESGDISSLIVLGSMHATGEAVPIVTKDEVLAAEHFKRAAELGDPVAQFKLAECYLKGEGVIRSDVEAYKWLTLSRSSGSKLPKEQLAVLQGRLTSSQLAEGQSRAEAFKPSLRPFGELSLDQRQQLAQSKYKQAMDAMGGDCLFATPQQVVEVVPLLEVAAKCGNPDAQYALAFLLRKDTPACSPMSAIKWRLRAAYQGQADAQLELACAYLYGNAGLEANLALAKKWRIVADQGPSQASAWTQFDANLRAKATETELAEGKKLAGQFFKIPEN